MAAFPRRGQQLLVQGIATAITALLIAGGAAWGAGAPDAQPTSAAEPTDAPEAGVGLRSQAEEPAGQTEQDEVKAAKEPKPAKAQKPAKAAGAKAKGPKAAKAAKAARSQGGGKALGHGKGNGRGKVVSAAARGETPPVGSCRNHGHWVSTVARGLADCDDNPRPAGDTDD